jgi:hypothetical protein
MNINDYYKDSSAEDVEVCMSEGELLEEINMVRKQIEKASFLKDELFTKIQENFCLMDVSYTGINADNLYDALSCYINYGEGNVSDIALTISRLIRS